MRDRDCYLVDEERAFLMCRGFIDHKGVLDEYTLTDGTSVKSNYQEPQSWGLLEAFKVTKHGIVAVEADATGGFFALAFWYSGGVSSNLCTTSLNGMGAAFLAPSDGGRFLALFLFVAIAKIPLARVVVRPLRGQVRPVLDYARSIGSGLPSVRSCGAAMHEYFPAVRVYNAVKSPQLNPEQLNRSLEISTHKRGVDRSRGWGRLLWRRCNQRRWCL
jgi:hypothetical protein